MTDMAFVIEPSGSIMAIMPGVAANTGNIDHVACYGHACKHSSVEISYVMDNCEHAFMGEYVDLLDELVRGGYEVYSISIDCVNDDDYKEARRQELGL